MFGKAFAKTAKVETAAYGFQQTGIYPFEDTVFDNQFVDEEKETETTPTTGIESAAKIRRCTEILSKIINPTDSSMQPRYVTENSSQETVEIPLTALMLLLTLLNSQIRNNTCYLSNNSMTADTNCTIQTQNTSRTESIDPTVGSDQELVQIY